jgi:protein-disulfide isomerase
VPLFEQVLEAYPDKVKLVFKNFPLRNHRNAMKAASAALAAEGQGKFWEFHDILFKNYNRLNDKFIGETATVLQLNQEQYEKRMNSPEVLNQIQKDIQDGQKAGVRGTPTIFINGRILQDRSLNGFKTIIDNELKKK